MTLRSSLSCSDSFPGPPTFSWLQALDLINVSCPSLNALGRGELVVSFVEFCDLSPITLSWSLNFIFIFKTLCLLHLVFHLGHLSEVLLTEKGLCIMNLIVQNFPVSYL